LGHAGLLIDAGGTRLVCDPWFSPEGAFQASWFPYPLNESQLEHASAEPAAILISHEHMDHVDPWYLARVPHDIPVVCPRYPSPALRTKILAGGSRPIVELDPWEEYEIGGTSVFFVSEESPMNHDSAMVIRGDDTTVLNMNDARMTAGQIRRIRRETGGAVDLLFLQAAGASWYPICYEYPEAQRRELAQGKRLAKFHYVRNTMAIAGASISFPFAGPPAFLDDELFWVNEQMGSEGIFPDQEQARAWLSAESAGATELLLPGDVWDHEERRREADPQWADFSFSNGAGYLRSYAEQRRHQIAAVKDRHPWPEASLWERFAEYFSHVLDMSAYFNDRVGIRVGFDIAGPGGGRWAIDFTDGNQGVFSDMGDPQYIYRFESRWLPPLLDGAVPWEDFFLSCRFRAYRSPNVYNDHLLGLLKFAWPEALDAVERFETADRGSDTFTVRCDGIDYAVQRYCPHAGHDLAESGEVLEGCVLRCAGHHYEFDLTTGECINGRSQPLEVERLTS
jgi:UDP-MurNAc hydroxylase